jgi:hypothetical protein
MPIQDANLDKVSGNALVLDTMMGDGEELLRLAYIKLKDAVELLQSIGEAEAAAAMVGRAALFAAET